MPHTLEEKNLFVLHIYANNHYDGKHVKDQPSKINISKTITKHEYKIKNKTHCEI